MKRCLVFAVGVAVSACAAFGATWTREGTKLTAAGWTLTVKSATVGEAEELTVTAAVADGTSTVLDLAAAEADGFNIVALGDMLFFNNKVLTEITLPTTLRTLGTGTFQNCTTLRTVSPFLPPSVTSVGVKCFNGASALSGALTLDPTGHGLSLGANCFCQTAIASVVIGEGVVDIPVSAFDNCRSLASATLPSTLETIGDKAFNWCVALTTVSPFLPASVRSVGTGAFLNCAVSANLVLSNPAVTVGATAFQGCKMETADLAGLEMISKQAFYSCAALTSARLSSTLKSIGDEAFFGCSKLERVSPFLPETVTNLGSKCFFHLNKLTGDLVCGGRKTPFVFSGTDQFDDSAIRSITFGTRVASIPQSFVQCYSVTNVDFKAYCPWSETAFLNFRSLQSRFRFPKRDEKSRAFVSDADNVTPWAALSESVQRQWTTAFPGERKPVGTLKTAPTDQWVCLWTPPDAPTEGLMLLLR